MCVLAYLCACVYVCVSYLKDSHACAYMQIRTCVSVTSSTPPPLPFPPSHRNELERVQLENLQFNINVSPSTYAKFYFDLRSLAEENGLLFPEEYVPLTRDRATKIEVCMHTCYLYIVGTRPCVWQMFIG